MEGGTWGAGPKEEGKTFVFGRKITVEHIEERAARMLGKPIAVGTMGTSRVSADREGDTQEVCRVRRKIRAEIAEGGRQDLSVE